MRKTCKCGDIYESVSKKQSECAECSRKRSREYYHRNKQKLSIKRRNQRRNGEINKEAERIYHRQYANDNKLKRRKYREKLSFFLAQAARRAKVYCNRKNAEFDINTAFLRQLWEKQKGLCAITGMQMAHKPHDLKSMSVDRIDPSKGYIKSNIHLVCKWVNFARSNHSLEEIKMVLKELQDGKMYLL